MQIGIAIKDQYPGYENSLVPCVFKAACDGHTFRFVEEKRAQIVLLGPFRRKYKFYEKHRKKYRNPNALYVFHTAENIRPDTIECDFALTFDLGVEDETHFRHPTWMDSFEWNECGVRHTPANQRFGRPIGIEELMQPIGRQVLKRRNRAAIFASHMREPRASLVKAISAHMPLDGYGPAYSPTITNHNESGFAKSDILKNYMFNLCPENSMYPGYYTEKIVEAFAAGCIPISWSDSNIGLDFNEAALINCGAFAGHGYKDGLAAPLSDNKLKDLIDSPLLMERPSIAPLVSFVENIIETAAS